MTDKRREAQRLSGLQHGANANLITPAETLRKRESWKYVAIKDVLEKSGRKFQFEYEIDGYIFDLALLDVMVIVEFDGNYHRGCQLSVDADKDGVAASAGFSIIRRCTISATVIDPVTIEGL